MPQERIAKESRAANPFSIDGGGQVGIPLERGRPAGAAALALAFSHKGRGDLSLAIHAWFQLATVRDGAFTNFLRVLTLD